MRYLCRFFFLGALLFSGLVGFACLVELGFHRRVLEGEFADGQAFSLVIGQTQVVLASDQGRPHLLKVGDGLVDFVDGGVEFLTCQAVVTAKRHYLKDYWIPAANNLKTFGHWQLLEVIDVDRLEEEILKAI